MSLYIRVNIPAQVGYCRVMFHSGNRLLFHMCGSWQSALLMQLEWIKRKCGVSVA